MRIATVLFLLSAIALAAAMGQSRRTDQPLTVAEIMRRSSNAVVQVVVSNQAGEELSLGSGFFVSADGEIITNYHVIEGAHSAIAKLANGSFFSVEGVLAADADRDLVLLKVGGRAHPFLNLAPISGLQVGDHVVAIGSPLGFQGTVSDGIVSALRSETSSKNWIQTTAPVSHGNSGGPLLDMEGNVVGVITWGVDLQQGQNLNFAIPSDEVRSLLSRAAELIPLDRFAMGRRPTNSPSDSILPSAAPPPEHPVSAVDDTYKYAAERLTAISDAIKQCPSGTKTDYIDGKPFSLFHYSAPMNVIWDIESHQSARSSEIGYIEFVQRRGNELVPPTPKPCKKGDKECRGENEDAQNAYTLESSATPPADNFSLRFEFDVASKGLHFARALVKREKEDATHWTAKELSESCPDKVIASEVGETADAPAR